MAGVKDKLYRDHALKMFVNGAYVYVIHLVYLVLNVLPGFVRTTILRVFLKECGSRVHIDHNVYIKFPWLVSIGDTVSINRGVEIYNDFFSKSKVIIGSGVRVAPNVKFHAAGHELDSGDYLNTGGDIVVGDDVWIGAGSYVLQNVSIGKGAVVAAGSVVTRDVPENTVVAGVPAKVIRELV